MIRRQTSATATTESPRRHGPDIEPELLHAAIQNPAAFEPVYRHYAPAIYTLLLPAPGTSG